MSGEDVGGSRLDVCKLSASGQSYQFSVPFGLVFHIYCADRIWHEEVQMHPCTGYNNLHKKVRWTTLILGVSDGNANPVSSFAILRD